MLLNAVINDSKIDLNNKEYIDIESSIRVYSVHQEKYTSILFAVDRIDATNFYSISTNSGLLIEMNLIDGKIYTKDFTIYSNSNNIFVESQKDFTEYKSYEQFFNNQKLDSIFVIDGRVKDYRKTVYSMMNGNFIALVFLNYFRNLFEELSPYDIVECIDDLDYDETLLSYIRRKGLCDNIFNLYISKLQPKYYNYDQTAFKRMYSKLLFDNENIEISERRIYNYFRTKYEYSVSARKLKIVKSLLPANCKISSVVSRLDYTEQLYEFDKYLNSMSCLIRDKVLKFIEDFISDGHTDISHINKLSELISFISKQFEFSDDTEGINEFINYYYSLKEMYDADLYEYGKKDGVTAGVIKAGVSSEWLYYYGKAVSLNERFGSNITYQPKELISAHHQISDNFYYLPDRDLKLKLTDLKCYSKITGIFGKTNSIISISNKTDLVLPQSKKDFIKEGLDLENFAKGYYDLVKKNKCMVLFLRHKDDINKCVCTLEFNSDMTKLVNTSCENNKTLNKKTMKHDYESIVNFCKDNNIDYSILNLN